MSTVQKILTIELTCLPDLIRKILGKNYNNALCNGAFWIFILWNILHSVFGKLLITYLKKLYTEKYICTRIKNSLWYIGFFCFGLGYYLLISKKTSITKNVLVITKIYLPWEENLPIHVIAGFTVINMFYLHTALWEGIKKDFVAGPFFQYLFLFVLSTYCYIIRILALPLTLTALISMIAIVEGATRIMYSIVGMESYGRLIVGSLFICSLIFFFAIHIILIPLVMLYPLAMIIKSNFNTTKSLLFCLLLAWNALTIYNSVLLNSLIHWLYHQKEKEILGKITCPGKMVECGLFGPRRDGEFYYKLFRNDMENRSLAMKANRKPKEKGALLLQTLKCMVAIKRKLTAKRLSDMDDSDDFSEDFPNDNDDNDKENTIYEENDDDDAVNVPLLRKSSKFGSLPNSIASNKEIELGINQKGTNGNYNVEAATDLDRLQLRSTDNEEDAKETTFETNQTTHDKSKLDIKIEVDKLQSSMRNKDFDIFKSEFKGDSKVKEGDVPNPKVHVIGIDIGTSCERNKDISTDNVKCEAINCGRKCGGKVKELSPETIIAKDAKSNCETGILPNISS